MFRSEAECRSLCLREHHGIMHTSWDVLHTLARLRPVESGQVRGMWRHNTKEVPGPFFPASKFMQVLPFERWLRKRSDAKLNKVCTCFFLLTSVLNPSINHPQYDHKWVWGWYVCLRSPHVKSPWYWPMMWGYMPTIQILVLDDQS